MAKSRFRRQAAAIIASGTLFATPALLSQPATASTPTFGIVIAVQQDGTPDGGAPGTWDPTSGLGFDSSPNDGVVRTFDTVAYRIDWSVNEADTTNATVSVTLPAGMFWTTLPSPCHANLTPASAISGPNLTCNLGDQAQGSNGTFVALGALGLVADGTVLSTQASIQGDGTTPVVSNPADVVASAGPKADLVSDLNTGSQIRSVENPSTGEYGIVFYQPITVEIPGTGKGAEPLAAQDLEINLDLSNLPPSGTLADSSWAVPPPNGLWNECGPNNAAIPGVPFGTIGVIPAATTTNAVANSGTWTCSYDSLTRQASVTVSGANLAPSSRPTNDTVGFPIAAGRNILVAGVVAMWISDADLQAMNIANYGTYIGLGTTPPVHSSWGTLPAGVSGDPITEENGTNNSASYGFEYTTPGGHQSYYTGKFSLGYINEGAGDLAFPTPRSLIATVPEHTPQVPTQTQVPHAGDGTVTAGERFGISLEISNDLGASAVRRANCVQLSAGQTVTPIGDYLEMDFRAVGNLAALLSNTPPTTSVRGAGSPFHGQLVAVSSMRMTSRVPWFAWFADNPLAPGDLSIEYSTDTHSHDGQCNSTYTWSSVPPTDLTTITQIRAILNRDMSPGDDIWIDVSLKALPLPIGTKIFQTSSYLDWAAGDVFDSNAIWDAGPDGAGYDPALYCDPAGGNPPMAHWNDCLTISGTRLAITKAVSSGKNAGLSVNETLTYTLKASAFGAPGGEVENLIVRDSLPAGLRWTGVASPLPTNGAVAGDTALEWDFGTTPNNDVKTITIEATVEPGYSPFDSITNVATVDADYDTGGGLVALDQRSSGAQIQTSGTFAAMRIQKSTPTPLIDKNQPMTFALSYRNTGVEDDVQPTFIDVLPWNGDGRSTPTNYTGTTSLNSVSTAGGETVRYTNTAPTAINPDPDHASNAVPGGATKWCLAAEFGTAGCPATIGDSTAVWMQHPANLAPGEQMNIELNLNTNGNIANDVYANNFTGRAANIKLPIKSNTVTVRVRGVDLTINKTPPPTATVGQEGTFNITVTNHGPGNATNIAVADPLPQGMAYIAATDNGTNDNGTVRWTIPTLNNGETKTLTVRVRFDTIGTNQNTANITDVTQDERSTTDNTSTATLQVLGTDAANTPLPPTTPTTPTTPVGAQPTTGTNTPTNTPRGALPNTGTNNTTQLLWTGLASLTIGAALARTTRQRKRLDTHP